MVHMKDDSTTLINLYRLYQLHHVTNQLLSLGKTARKYKVKNVALPGGFLNKDGGDDSEHSDYNEDDFKDLMSLQ